MQKHKEYDWKDSNVALIGTSEDRALKKDAALTEPAWQPILSHNGPGLFVFRINKFKVEPVPKEDYGKFFNGDSYIVLNIYKVNDSLEYDVHFWIGKYSTQDEYGTAAYKTVEIDNLLDDKPVQHREVEGHESELFKSYFKTMQLLNGGYETGFRHVKPEEYQPRLLHFSQQGTRVEVQERTFSRQSLSSDDVFIIDLGSKAYQWNGKKCSFREKHSAAQFLQQLESDRHGKTKSEVIDEADDSDNKMLLNLLPDEPVSEKAFHGGSFQKKVYKMSDASGKMEFSCISEGSAPQSCIQEDDVYYIMGQNHLFVYIGDQCSSDERKNALIFGSQLMNSSEDPTRPITVVNQQTAAKKGMSALLD